MKIPKKLRVRGGFIISIIVYLISVNVYAADLTNQVYIDSEKNLIADVICTSLKTANTFLVPISAILLTIFGFAAYNGKLQLSSLVVFAIALGIMRGFGPIIEYALPGIGLKNGCDCATERIVRKSDGTEEVLPTGLDKDCNIIEELES